MNSLIRKAVITVRDYVFHIYIPLVANLMEKSKTLQVKFCIVYVSQNPTVLCHRHPIVPHIHYKFTNRHFHLHQLFLKLSFSFSFSILKMLAFHFPCPLITNHQLPLVFLAQFAFLFFSFPLSNTKIFFEDFKN